MNIKDLIYSTNRDDVLLAIILDPEYCISIMNKPGVGEHIKWADLGEKGDQNWYIAISNKRIFGFEPESFISLIVTKKLESYLADDVKLLYNDKSIEKYATRDVEI